MEVGIIEDCLFCQEKTAENGYTFCASADFSETGFLRWYNEVGYDACFEIFDPLGFQRAMTRAIRKKGFFFASGEPIYVDGDIDGESERRHTPPAFVKQKEYAWQTEYRWVWTAHSSNTDPVPEVVVLNNPRRFCRPVALIDGGNIRYLVPASQMNSLTAGVIPGPFQIIT